MNYKEANNDRIAITGIGLVTPLGVSAPSSLTAIRGGIANFFEHETVMVNDNEFGTELSGAIIARLPEDIVSRRVSGADRATILLAPAIRECVEGIPQKMLGSVNWRINSMIGPDNFNFTDILRTELGDLPIPNLNGNVLDKAALGRCLFFENIIQAIADLRNGACQMALAGCVDSLCESTTLEQLAEADRLKSGTNPEGIVAGEAAGVILLELEPHARRRNAAIHAFISAWGRGTEPDPWTGATPSTAKGLTNAFHEAFARLPGKGEEIDMVIADMNGERARAHEWGFTSGRIFPVDNKARELMHPADCAGDCGSALGPVLLATAAGVMSDAQSPANIALSTSDDGGARRILCLEKGDDRDGDAIISTERKKCLPVLPAVIEQHNDEAPFLWLLRNRLIKAPHCGLHDLARHDKRIEAHLDGLRLSGEAGWEMCEKALRHGNAGDYFSAAFLAFKNGNEDHIAHLLDKKGADPVPSKGIISALGWLPHNQAESYITRFIAEDSPALLRIGIAASAIHRIDPGKNLNNAIANENQALKARSLKAAGELGRIDLLPLLAENLSHKDEACRFHAAWSAALLGNRDALQALQFVASGASLYREEAVKTAFRMLERQNARTWHTELASDSETSRLAIIGAGTAGDPALVPWLIEQMRITEHAQVAGEAFTMITGANIVYAGLKGEKPYDFDEDPDDDLEIDVSIPPDENLPWPDPQLVDSWWRQNRSRFDDGTRYFLGNITTSAHLRQTLHSGSQRQRANAAVELALINPGTPLFETRGPGFRQMEAQ